jgi:hypothetical protein
VRPGNPDGPLGNHGYEAAYYGGPMDDRGELLTGARRYEIRLQEPPPAQAFWSITMYSTPDYFLVANPIDRYSIGDRTAGRRRAQDGSLTIYIQHDDPGAEKTANWLPAPAAGFRPALRAYIPESTIIDESWVIPAITRVD